MALPLMFSQIAAPELTSEYYYSINQSKTTRLFLTTLFVTIILTTAKKEFMGNTAPSNNDTNRLLKRTVDDLKHLHKSAIASLDSIRNRTLGLLGGEIAAITFLFGTGEFYIIVGDTCKQTMSCGMPFISGDCAVLKITLFIVGILLLIISLIFMLYILQPVKMPFPPYTRDIKDVEERFHNSEEEYLNYMKREYMASTELLATSVNRRSCILVWTIRLLPIGVLIMIMLKYL